MQEGAVQTIKKLHTTSYKGIWYLLKKRKFYKASPFICSVVVSILVGVVFICHADRAFDSLKELADLVMTTFPCLLGFTLAGFAVIVAFPNLDLIEKSSKTDGVSLYQALGGFFALCVILQTIATAMGFAFLWLIKIDISKLTWYLDDSLANLINITAIVSLVFVATYSISLMPFIAFNLFSLLQVNSLFFTVRKHNMAESKDADSEF